MMLSGGMIDERMRGRPASLPPHREQTGFAALEHSRGVGEIHLRLGFGPPP